MLGKLFQRSSKQINSQPISITIGKNRVKVWGVNAEKWEFKGGRSINLTRVTFEAETDRPMYCEIKKAFVLPVPNNPPKYTIHLLGTGEAMIMIDNELYLCTRHKGTPTVFAHPRTTLDF